MPANGRACATCAQYEPSKTECRLRPPAYVTEPETATHDEHLQVVFPKVNGTDWCAQWVQQPREG